MQGKFNQEAWVASESLDTSETVVSVLALAGLNVLKNLEANEGEIRSMASKCEVMAHAFVRQSIELSETAKRTTNEVDCAASRATIQSARDLEVGFGNLADKLRARLPRSSGGA